LEGLTDYDNWQQRIDYRKKHRPLAKQDSEWINPKSIHSAFEALFNRHRDSILVVSYRDNGIPSEQELFDMLKRHKRNVHVEKKRNYKYVLSAYSSSELLFIAQ